MRAKRKAWWKLGTNLRLSGENWVRNTPSLKLSLSKKKTIWTTRQSISRKIKLLWSNKSNLRRQRRLKCKRSTNVQFRGTKIESRLTKKRCRGKLRIARKDFSRRKKLLKPNINPRGKNFAKSKRDSLTRLARQKLKKQFWTKSSTLLSKSVRSWLRIMKAKSINCALLMTVFRRISRIQSLLMRQVTST